jgi:vitamin B12 transporter
VRLDFALQAAPSQLDEVVVTGTATPTAVKAVPTPISVVTARDLEQAGVARVDDVLRGMVPGAVKMGTGVRDGYPGIAFRGAVSFDGLGEMPVKVYVDGVPMAYPHAMSQLDPSIIERVEITRGPQASTIYGAGAVAGVIQIFTKKGSTANGRPQISVQVAAGGLESEWRDKSTVHQDHSLAVIGGTDALSYNVSAGYESLGPWVPEYESERMSYFGAVRSTQGPASVELTASYSDRVYNFPSVDPIYREQIRSGNWRTPNDPFYSMPWNPDERRTNGTLGLNAAYSPKAWWQHRFTVGFDRYTNPRAQSAPRQLTPADTLRTYSEYASSTTTLAYNTTISAPLTESLASTFTLGLDRWSTREGGLSGTRHSDGSFAAGRSNVTKREHGNSGLFAQAQLGLADALFLTAGVRADWSDNFGADFGAAIAPRVGLAYTRDLGPVLLKSRVAYGEAIRAPLPHQKQASRINLPTSESLGNPDLGPESQRGYDAGLELFAGPRTTLRVTYYLQEVENLIGSITLTQPGEIPQRFRSENIGGIENSGWEFEGSTGRGPITVAGTYSIYNSTAEKLAPAALGDGRGQYHVGDRILRIPRSMGGLSLRYDRGGTHVTTDATYVGSFRNYDFIRYNNDRFANPPIAQPARGYLIDYPAHTKWNASFTRALTAQLSAFVRVNNIANSFAPEMDNLTPAHGRLTMIGLKAQP